MPPKVPPRSSGSNAGGPTPTPQSPAPQGPPEFDLTIQGELNKIKNVKDRFPAVDLLGALLRFINVNVNLAPRDIHTSAQIVIRSNKLYEAIIQSMETLDQSSIEQLDGYWPLFEGYTTAIPVLERVLLDLAKSTEKERPHSPPNSSTQDAVRHIALWLADRKVLKEALEALKQKSLKDLSTETSKAVDADYIAYRRKDDDSTLRVLRDAIDKSQLTDRHIFQNGQQLLTDVKTLVKDISVVLQQKPATNEEPSGIAVRAVMTAYIPFGVLGAFQSNKLSVEWQNYLRSAKIWEAVKALLTKVKAHLESQAVVDFEKEFKAVELLLISLADSPIDTAKELLELIKLSAYIHRPYSGRTAVLVKAFFFVDHASRQDKSLVLHRHDLRQAMQTAIDHLTKVKDSPYNLQTFSMESKDYKDRKAAHKDLFDNTVRPQFTTFKIPTDWTTQEIAYTTAVDVDEKNVEDAQGQLYPST